MEIKVGTRPSPLALKQIEEVMGLIKKIYPGADFSIHRIPTSGDRDKTTPLSDVEGSDFFTREIDDAVLSGRIDVGVHSSKDLPDIMPEGLIIIAETESVSPYDALVSRGGKRLKDLPRGSRIGASSKRRKDEIRAVRNDLAIVDVRGNIEERLALIDEGRIDALIVAHAALIRLGLTERIAEILPLNSFNTHPKQGKISLVARKKR